jgi:hypothetical protein
MLRTIKRNFQSTASDYGHCAWSLLNYSPLKTSFAQQEYRASAARNSLPEHRRPREYG